MDRTTQARTLDVQRPAVALVRVATCPEREVILDVGRDGNQEESYAVALTVSQAREVGMRLIEAAAEAEARVQG